jgi:hypothetical protein
LRNAISCDLSAQHPRISPKACTGIGRAILLDRFFFFRDFACLDRQTNAAGFRVNAGHAGINLVTHLEALWALVGAFTCQIRTADEGSSAVIFHLDAAFFDGSHFTGHDRATLHAVRRFGEGIMRPVP